MNDLTICNTTCKTIILEHQYPSSQSELHHHDRVTENICSYQSDDEKQHEVDANQPIILGRGSKPFLKNEKKIVICFPRDRQL